MTGATGFLGSATLIEAQTLRPDIGWTALVRGATQEEARSRLFERLRRFGDPVQARRIVETIEVIPAGLDDLDDSHLPRLKEVTAVLHLAADTSFTTSQGLWQSNFDGTMKLASLARKLPKLQRFIHVSTAMISGETANALVKEQDFPRLDVQHLVEYSRVKATTEFVLRERFSDLPLVVARPSIVAGHTRVGCLPSTSIFWFVRFGEAVGLIPVGDACTVDIVPVDWVAGALLTLTLKPQLAAPVYHLSSGVVSRARWMKLAESVGRYRAPGAPFITPDVYSRENPRQMEHRMAARLGVNGPAARVMQRAAQRYFNFCALNVTFDNQLILREGVTPPPSLEEYVDTCLRLPNDQSIMQAFADDFDMFRSAEMETSSVATSGGRRNARSDALAAIG